MNTLLGCIISLFLILLVTIPSILYGISDYVLFPVGFLLSLFTKQPSIIKSSIIATRITPFFLLFIVPFILYVFTWEPLGWIFFGWILLYLIISVYSGASKKRNAVTDSWKLALDNSFYQEYLYIRERKAFVTLGIIITVASPIIGYFLNFDPFFALLIGLSLALITIRLSKC
jgi:hypothetical protein